MIYAQFAIMTKRENSTKLPTQLSANVSIRLKDGCSILRPSIEVSWPDGGTPTANNYCFINSPFRRYYWVDNWTYERGMWVADMHCDVLATYRTYIGLSSKYVLRSASDKNLDAIDSLYPATTEYTQGSQTISNGLVRFGDGGSYVMACVNDQTISYTATQPPLLFQVSAKGVQDVMHNVIDSFEGAANDLNTAAGADFKDAITMILKAPARIFSDITQFVKSVMWFPCSFTGTASPVYVGKYSVDAQGSQITDPIWSNSMIDVNLANFVPAGAEKWKYSEPYASYYLNCPPFGIIPIPSEDIINGYTLRLSLSIDALSGLGRLIVKIRKGSDPVTTRDICDRTAQVGISFPFGGSTPDYASGIAGAGAMGAAVAMMEAGTGGAGMVMAGAIGTAAKGLGYQGFSGGGFSGGALGIEPTWSLNWRYFVPVDQDPAEQGSPLCKVKTLNTLSGYIKTADGEVEAVGATSQELAQISAYLTGGFFYE